jgi:hypothetical protein
VVARTREILEALLFTTRVNNHPLQMLLADDAEQFRTHRPGVLLQETQQLLHALVIDLCLGAE